MRKFAIILSALMAAAFTASAQHNAYSIDDECYTYFQAAEHTVDDVESNSFDEAVQSLLETALRKKDTKAQTLYYVEILKRESRLAQSARNKDISSWDSGMWNARIDEARETAQRISKATGYMQYYYYSSELCQTYYFNTRQDIQATEMLSTMMEEAKENEDEYGTWKCLMYLGKLYMRISDNINTQKSLREVVKIFETSQDPTIKRQSMTIQYCDLADTYPIASDSARMYYGKAAECRMTLMDSVRVAYYGAQLDAWDNNLQEYRNKKDFCLSNAFFINLIRGGKNCFNCIDNILAGNAPSKYRKDVDALYYRQQMYYVAELAAQRGQWETSARVLGRLTARLYRDISLVSNQRLEQLTAHYETNRLEGELQESARRLRIAMIHVGALLLVLIVVIVMYFRKHKK